MSDFQQNTITNRQAVLDYIDANSGGGGGGSQTLSDVLNTGNTSGPNPIIFDELYGLIFDNNSRLQEGTIADLNSNKGIAQICGVGYELKWASGVLYSMSNTGTIIFVSMFNANTPTVNDDNTLGYQVGSYWIMNDGYMYVCADTTTGSAVWAIHCPFNLDVVLKAGASTGGNVIVSPDTFTELRITDGEGKITCGSSITNTNNYINVLSNKIDYFSEDTVTNDFTYIEQVATNIAIQNNSASGSVVNLVNISQSGIRLIYDDTGGGINHELRVDADGYYMKDIPAHDDDAAAVAAGLTAGYVFQTTGSGAITTPGVVCIVQ